MNEVERQLKLMGELEQCAQDVICEWMRVLERIDPTDPDSPFVETLAHLTRPRMMWQGADERDGWLYGKLADGYGVEQGEYRFRVEVQRVVREEEERQPIWAPRTMVDVRAGDVIRMPGQPGTERTVYTATPLPWHVHPAADPYRPNEMPAEWSEIKVRFEDMAGPFSFAPTMAVEIELTPEEVGAIELLGWENRLRVEAS